MASLPDGYELGSYSSANFTKELLYRYKYGVACVSNVDGRGNMSIYSVMRRQGKRPKPIFDYANILGYVGGEIRDGFCNANLKEGEAVRLMQTHVDLSQGRTIRMVYCPVEEVSALFVVPLHQKALSMGLEFPDKSTACAFEYFKEVANYCPYKNVEEYFDAKLGKSPRNVDSKNFSNYRAELESWWLEKSELLYHDCPLPSQPPTLNLSSLSSMTSAEEFMSGFLQQATQWSRNYDDSESWKKTVVQKFTSALNYERFGGMARQQALWYIWMGDTERAKVMVDAWEGLEKDKKTAALLDVNNVVIDHILGATLANLSSRGMCLGQSIIDARLTPKGQCDTCLSPVSPTKKRQGLNVMTCVDKDANGEFGCKSVRENVAKLLFAVSKFGINKDFTFSAIHCLKEALHTFLEHSFQVLFWRIKPTNPMTVATEKEAVPRFIQLLKTKEKLDVSEWVNSCSVVLSEALSNHCSRKLGERDVKKLCDLFHSKMKKVVAEFKKLVKEDASTNPAEKLTEEDASMDLFRKTVAPSMAQQFKHKWRLFSDSKRKKLLTVDAKCLVQACSETFEQMEMIGNRCGMEGKAGPMKSKSETEESTATTMVENGNTEGDDYKKNASTLSSDTALPTGLPEEDERERKPPEKCADESCPCKDDHKFWQHLVGVLTSKKNPIPFYNCLVSGDLVLKEEHCLDQEGEFFDKMVDMNEELFAHGSTCTINDEVFSDKCPRLCLLCCITCHRLLPMLMENVINTFGEIERKDNIRFECQPCQACGTLESQPGDFKRCGGCRSVFYCGRKCQACDWKAGHKQQCKAQNKGV